MIECVFVIVLAFVFITRRLEDGQGVEGRQKTSSRQQTRNRKQQTTDSKQQTADSRHLCEARDDAREDSQRQMVEGVESRQQTASRRQQAGDSRQQTPV
jgi:hypothetical protein